MVLNALLYMFEAKKICKKKSLNKLSLPADSLQPVLGAWLVLRNSLPVMNILNQTESAILLLFFLPRDVAFQNLFILTADVVPCCGR